MKMTDQQLQVISSTSKRIVVLACPGSGKTAVITEKLIQLIGSGTPMKKILSVTFTRKAAKEMLERLEKKIAISKSESKNICTLHSLGCRLLFSYKDLVGLKDGYKVALFAEKETIAKNVLPEQAEANEIIRAFLEYVSALKNGIDSNRHQFTRDQFADYCERMLEANLIDLDDYIYLPVRILQENTYIRDRIREEYDYIFVDEYQDINKMQNDLLTLITRDQTSIMYVGDDDQSIYEFRGSNPNYILEKTKPESGYDVYFLTRNFRSQQPIVEFSKKILDSLEGANRLKKEIVADKTAGNIQLSSEHSKRSHKC